MTELPLGDKPIKQGSLLAEVEKNHAHMNVRLGDNKMGRKIVVVYTCGRCGKSEYLPYEDLVMLGGEMQKYYGLKELYPPRGWEEHDNRLLCGDCTNSFKEWMNRND